MLAHQPHLTFRVLFIHNYDDCGSGGGANLEAVDVLSVFVHYTFPLQIECNAISTTSICSVPFDFCGFVAYSLHGVLHVQQIYKS